MAYSNRKKGTNQNRADGCDAVVGVAYAVDRVDLPCVLPAVWHGSLINCRSEMIWSFWFILIVTLTGLWDCWRHDLYHGVRNSSVDQSPDVHGWMCCWEVESSSLGGGSLGTYLQSMCLLLAFFSRALLPGYQEMSSFGASAPFCHNVSALEPVCHGLKPVPLWAKQTTSSFKLNRSQIFSQQWESWLVW